MQEPHTDYETVFIITIIISTTTITIRKLFQKDDCSAEPRQWEWVVRSHRVWGLAE